MQKQWIASEIALLSVCAIALGQAPGTAKGELVGKVLDDADDTAIQGVSVKASQVNGSVKTTTLTERDGTYKITGLPIRAKFKITYDKEGYVPDETELVVTAKNDGRLLKLQGDKPYYEKKAAKIKAIVTQNQEAWDREWAAVERSPILPVAKGWIAQSLRSVVPKSRQSEVFIAYATADLDQLKKLDAVVSWETIAAQGNINGLILGNVRAAAATAKLKF